MKHDLLRRIPSIAELLACPRAAAWLEAHPRPLVTECIRSAVEELRKQVLADAAGKCGPMHVTAEYILQQAGELLADRTRPHLRGAINATGVILHTGLGRAVLPAEVVDSIVAEMKGYVTLAIDRSTGLRSDRDRRVEYLLTELTGAEAATVVNNNAAATMLTLAALAAGREVVVSRGQLIEIGGAFRLPDVMALSGARLVEVGTTNRTHARDYERALTDATAAILRVHPSNFRVVGFTAEVEIGELAELAHKKGTLAIDDLGAGALVHLEDFGLPHEPTVRESIAAGADVALFSADKLIGASQGGIIVGRKELIDRIRKHPLARACRVDKICLMALERTLMLFRDPPRLPQRHPLYQMLATPTDDLRRRAEALAAAIAATVDAASSRVQSSKRQNSTRQDAASTDAASTSAPRLRTAVEASESYLGSGSLPMHALPSFAVMLSADGVKAEELARRLRMDDSAVFARIDSDRVVLDVRAVADEQVPLIAAAVGRAMAYR